MREKLIYSLVALVVVIILVVFLVLRKSGGNESTVAGGSDVVNKLESAAMPIAGSSDTQDYEGTQLQEAIKSGRSLVLVDVREPSEFVDGRIPGARNVPLGQLQDRLGELPKESEYVVICRSGNRSGRAKELLKSAGYSRVHNLSGGMLSWAGQVEK